MSIRPRKLSPAQVGSDFVAVSSAATQKQLHGKGLFRESAKDERVPKRGSYVHHIAAIRDVLVCWAADFIYVVLTQNPPNAATAERSWGNYMGPFSCSSILWSPNSLTNDVRKGLQSARRLSVRICFVVVSCLFASTRIPAQSGEWVWMGGGNTVPDGAESGPPGIYGTLGTSAAGNIPGGRGPNASWKDSSGNFWLFQAYGFDSAGTNGALNDLWEFNPSTGQWAWMGGSNVANTALSGVYGALGSAASGNLPGFRNSETIWTDSNGKIWLFGGSGYDSAGTQGLLDDLWRFDPSAAQWTWMGGSTTVPSNWQSNGGVAGTYGTLGTPAVGNFPGSRSRATAWTDSEGNLWMFGGLGYDSASTLALLDDLWEFIPATNEWVWMGGSSTIPAPRTNWPAGIPGTYGNLGVPDPANQPGSRGGGTGWSDSSGNFWLYGGGGLNDQGVLGSLTDVWDYNPATQEWTWMGGTNLLPMDANGWTDGRADGCQVAQYGPIGQPDAWSTPGCGALATWADSKGNLWVFGGGGDGLWEYSTSSLMWTLWNGQSMVAWPGIYGTEGVPASGNIPGYRSGSSEWSDSSGDLWLFGGIAVDANNVQGFLNDLWEYQPAPPPVSPAATPVFTPQSGTYLTQQTVTILDATLGVTIYYTTDWTNPTTSSTVYRGPFTLSTTTMLTAMASGNGYSASMPVQAEYKINPAPSPVISPDSGSYPAPLSVTISDSLPGATVYYTTDGSNPTNSSPVYSAPIILTTSGTVEAIAAKSGYSKSDRSLQNYVLPPLVIPVTGISLPSTASMVVGATTMIPSSITPSTATNPVLNWICSNPNVATVSATGIITGIAAGTTQITTGSTDGTAITSNICTLAVNAPFTFGSSTASGNSATVAAGATAVYALVLTPAIGTQLLSPVTLSAAGLPAGATFTFTPGTIAAGSGAANVSLSIQTAKTSALLGRSGLSQALSLCVLLLSFGALSRRSSRFDQPTMYLLYMFLALGGMVALSACLGGGGTRISPVSYTITVTASNGQSTTTTQLTLTVQ